MLPPPHMHEGGGWQCNMGPGLPASQDSKVDLRGGLRHIYILSPTQEGLPIQMSRAHCLACVWKRMAGEHGIRDPSPTRLPKGLRTSSQELPLPSGPSGKAPSGDGLFRRRHFLLKSTSWSLAHAPSLPEARRLPDPPSVPRAPLPGTSYVTRSAHRRSDVLQSVSSLGRDTHSF